MVKTLHIAPAVALSTDFEWLIRIIDTRIRLYFGHECDFLDIWDVPFLVPGTCDSPYAKWLTTLELSPEEHILLLLALAPHIRPELLDVFFTKNAEYDREFSEFGGFCVGPHHGFYPTGETALFVLAGGDIERRILLQECFDKGPLFGPAGMLRLDDPRPGSSRFSGLLHINAEAFQALTTGGQHEPDFSKDFPARRITAKLDWEDLILEPRTFEQVQEILGWLQHKDTLLNKWGLGRRLRSGYHALFYGPPGTGKTLCAALMGKAAERPVYRIDLSMVVSKYIGETEKNLARVFDLAQNRDWLLFFDEADALFGKRTDISNAHDKYANQEVSYLLQRIEDFPGVIILASNKKQNFDEAFSRRFQSIIHFPMPGPAARRRIWEMAFSPMSQMGSNVDFGAIAERHEMAGGAIMNVVKYASLRALMRDSVEIWLADIEDGIRRELQKEGRTL